ncbi:MAG: PAS domain-containing protein [Chloroflexi bacterium]|nr:PAS domain-containing protein [Chloroflexota bacterium]
MVRHLRIESMQWLVGLFCGFLGTIMLIAPHQFQFVARSGVAINLLILGLSLLIIGLALLAVIVFIPRRAVAITIHVISSAVLVIFAVVLFKAGLWVNGTNYALLGIGIGLAPIIGYRSEGSGSSKVSERWKDGDLLVYMIGIAMTLVGLNWLRPKEAINYHINNSPELNLLFGIAFLLFGLGSTYLQVIPVRDGERSRWVLRFQRIVCWAIGLLFLAFVLVAARPERVWMAGGYYAFFGAGLLILPDLRRRLPRFDPTLLYTRMALAFATVTAIPLILTVAICYRLSENPDLLTLTGNLRNVRAERDLILGILLLFIGLTTYAGTRMAAALASPLERLSAAAHAMAEGDTSAPLPSSTITEINRLSSSFALMRDRLAARTVESQRAHRALEEYQALLEQRVIERTSALEQANQIAKESARLANEAARQISAIFDSLTDAVVVYDKNGVIQSANPRAVTLFGFDPVGLPKEQVDSQISLRSPDGLKVKRLPSTRVFDGEKLANERFLLINKQGVIWHEMVSASPVYVNGEMTGVVVVWHDVTELERLLVENRRQRELLERLLNDVPVGIAFLEVPDFRFSLINSAYAEMARDRGELIGRPIAEVLPELADRVIPPLEYVVESGQQYSEKEVLFRADEDSPYQDVYVSVSIAPIPDIEGRVEGVLLLVFDVTDQVITRHAIEEERARLEGIINNAPVGITLIDLNGRVQLANPTSEYIYGFKLEGINLSEPELDLHTFSPEGAPLSYDELPIAQAFRSGQPVRNAEVVFQQPSGVSIHVLANAAPLFDTSGEIFGGVVIFQDVTEIKKVEAELRRSEAHERARAEELEVLMDAVPAAVWIAHDPQCHSITGNRAAYELHDMPPGVNPTQTPAGGLPDFPFRTLKDGVEVPPGELPMQVSAREGIELKDIELTIVLQNGMAHHLYGNVSPLLDERGNPRGSVGAFLDISKLVQVEQSLRQSEAQLRESEARFRGLVESMNDVVFTADKNLVITGVYGGVAREPFDAYDMDTVIGRSLREIWSEVGQIHIEPVARAVSGENVLYNWSIETKEGLSFFQTNLSPLYDDAGRVTGAVGVIHEVSAIKRAEKALEEYAEQLQRSNQELEQFAFIASHDLQEPLRKIQAFSERLNERYAEIIEPDARDYLNRIARASYRMQRMIDALLAFSRVTTKGQPFVRVNLNELLNEVLYDLEIRIDREGGEVIVEELPELEADPVQMHQLLQNLISNGLKYHRKDVPPVVKISGEILPSGQRGAAGQVRLVVEDNGIGFDEQHLSRIFQPFERLHGRSEYEGTGMGLAICRKIVERHHGSITATSRPGEGSRFIITLPMIQRSEQG